jgi:hypothetical protein
MLSHTHHKASLSRSAIIRRVVVRMICFAIAECWLNAVNLDTLADYYEFMQGQLDVTIAQHQVATIDSFEVHAALLG